MSIYRRLCSHFDRLAGWAVRRMGSATAFVVALSIVILWGVTGPLFGFSNTWQLVINTSTTIITFLMVFLLQHSQNKDSTVLHAKLNELIAATEGASNRLIDLEELSEDEIELVRQRFIRLFQNADRLRPGEKTSLDAGASSAAHQPRQR